MTITTWLADYFRTPPSVGATNSLEEFGATGNGVNDDTAAYRLACAALASAGGGCIVLGANRIYLINRTGDSDARLPENSSIVGFGECSTIKTTVNHPVIDIAGPNCFLSNFRILGSSAGTSQHGIYVGRDGVPGSGTSKFRAAGVVCENMGGRGFSIQYSDFPFLGPVINDCVANACDVGFFNYSSDYNQYSNCLVYECYTGVDVGTGNHHWTGGSVTGCHFGFIIRLVGNDSHGTVTGTAINHCAVPVTAEAIVNGHQFVGCTIFTGDINLTNSHGIRFIGCTLDLYTYTFNGSQGTQFLGGNVFPMYQTNTITSTNGARTLWGQDCRTLDGDVPPFITHDFTDWVFVQPGVTQMKNVSILPDKPTGGAILFGQDDAIEGMGADIGHQQTVAPK